MDKMHWARFGATQQQPSSLAFSERLPNGRFLETRPSLLGHSTPGRSRAAVAHSITQSSRRSIDCGIMNPITFAAYIWIAARRQAVQTLRQIEVA